MSGVESTLALSGDHDPPVEGEALAQEAVQAPDAALETVLFVVDGDDDVDVAHRDCPAAGLGDGASCCMPQNRRRRFGAAWARLRDAWVLPRAITAARHEQLKPSP